MLSDDQDEPRVRQTAGGAPLDLMAVYDNLVPIVHAYCGDVASDSNPVLFAFIDTSAVQVASSMMTVLTDISRALWTQGLEALRDIADAALDPSRQLDAMSRLGLERGLCPNLAVLVFQFWPVHENCDGRLQKSQSYEPRIGVPHRLQVELRAHGCAPVITEWKVLQREGSACAVPPPPRHFVGPVDPVPPRLPTAEDVAAAHRAAAEASRLGRKKDEAMLAQLPTFIVQSPPLREGGRDLVHLNDSLLVRFRDGDSQASVVAPPDAVGFVTLQMVNGLVVPTFYGTDSETSESFWPRGTEMVVHPARGGSSFKIVVIQPLKVV